MKIKLLAVCLLLLPVLASARLIPTFTSENLNKNSFETILEDVSASKAVSPDACRPVPCSKP